MSVDTYLKGKDLSPYRLVEVDGVQVHVSPALTKWAQGATLAARSKLVGSKLEVLADHKHQPT